MGILAKNRISIKPSSLLYFILTAHSLRNGRFQSHSYGRKIVNLLFHVGMGTTKPKVKIVYLKLY
jgi:hypothetical protein